MNILLRELRANLKSLIIWSVIVLLFVIVGFSKFSAYEGNPELLAILDSIPPAMLEAFNFNAFNLTTISGFFGVMFTYFALLLSISAAMWGTDIITKEERDKTVEFILTLPVKREKLVISKILAALVICAAMVLVSWGATLLGSSSYKTDSAFYEFVALSMLALFMMQVIFLAIGILIGSAMKHFKRASSLAVSVIIATYFLSILSGLDKDLDFLKYFTPFKYFNPANLLHESRLEMTFVWISAGIVIASLAGALFSYSRRDLYI